MPWTMVKTLERMPVDGTVVMASGVQLTGMSLLKALMTGWLGSALHSSTDAREPG